MPDAPQITFADNVRVRATPETEASGYAGLVGQVYGGTTPSATGVRVIGELKRDCAVAVRFKDREETVWFAEQLIEFVDHAPGTQITAGGTTRVRTETGEWCQTRAEPTAPAPAPNVERDNRRVKIIIGIVAAIFIIIFLSTIIRGR